MGISKGWWIQTIIIVFFSCLTTLVFTSIWYREQPYRLEAGNIWISFIVEKENYNVVSTSVCGHCGSDFVGAFQALKSLNFTEGKWYRVVKWRNIILEAKKL